jgi:hypothetical protein
VFSHRTSVKKVRIVAVLRKIFMLFIQQFLHLRQLGGQHADLTDSVIGTTELARRLRLRTTERV